MILSRANFSWGHFFFTINFTFVVAPSKQSNVTSVIVPSKESYTRNYKLYKFNVPNIEANRFNTFKNYSSIFPKAKKLIRPRKELIACRLPATTDGGVGGEAAEAEQYKYTNKQIGLSFRTDHGWYSNPRIQPPPFGFYINLPSRLSSTAPNSTPIQKSVFPRVGKPTSARVETGNKQA